MTRLKRIELLNFKSYSGFHEIILRENFQCIVGPNGAGKSNIVDAISFALGIKSSKLRGSNLRDLVYRRIEDPDDLIRPASVTLVFEREILGERKFSRKINNESSSYIVDDESVSFRDYQLALSELDIFPSARLSFLVFQGDVESIATKSPKELTRLFEEIAGSGELISEYEEKLRAKEIAEEEAMFQFQKKKGMQAEKKQFKEQKQEAEEFKKLRDAHKKSLLKQKLFLLCRLQANIRANRGQIAKKMAEKAKIEKSLGFSTSSLSSTKSKQALEQSKMIQFERSIREIERKIDQKKPEKVKLKEEISYFTKQIASKKAELESIEQNQTKYKETIQQLETDVRKAREQQTLLQKKMQDEGTELQSITQNIREYQELKEQMAGRMVETHQKLDGLQREQDLAFNSSANKKNKLVEFEERRKQTEEKISQLKSRLDKANSFIQRTEEQVAEMNDEWTGQAEKAKLNSQKKERLVQEIEEKQSILREAKATLKSSDREKRFGEIVETLKRMFPNTVRGRIVELSKPTLSKYQMAVTVTLGRNMDAIVVDDKRTAEECIDYLKEQRLGTATFLPLDSISSPTIHEHLRNIAPSIKLVADVIDYPPAIRKAILYACGNTVVCETLGDARRLAFEAQPRIRVVTTDGVLIQKNGTMTGGISSSLESNASRWDVQQIEKIKRERDRLIKELNELERAPRRDVLEKQHEAQLFGLNSRLEYARTDFDLTSSKIIHEEKVLDILQTQIDQINSELGLIDNEMADRRKSIQIHQEQVRAEEDRVFHKFCRKIGVSNIRDLEEEHFREVRERMEKSLELCSSIAALEYQLEYEKQRNPSVESENLRTTIREAKKTLDEKRVVEAKLDEGLRANETQLRETDKKFKDSKEKVAEAELTVRTQKKVVEVQLNESNEIDKQMFSMRANLFQLKIKRHNLLQEARFEGINIPCTGNAEMQDDDVYDYDGSSQSQSSQRPKSRKKRSRRSQDDEDDDDGEHEMQDDSSSQSQIDEYKPIFREEDQTVFDFSKLSGHERETAESLDTLRFQTELDKQLEEIKALTNQLEKMDPNLKAISRFQDVTSRLSEVNNLFDSTKTLSKEASNIFSTVKKRRYENFMKFFTPVSKCIDEIYKQLTLTESGNGGTAHLSLENTEEPYLGGLKFNAMPPGKRFRDMEQLSGGEKTVAALALLFAIHTVHQTPLLVMDEVDAALDRRNILRVAAYIMNKKGQMQFLITSLQDKFFENADTLLGITRDPTDLSSKAFTLSLLPFLPSLAAQ